jgi:hypothetical protein
MVKLTKEGKEKARIMAGITDYAINNYKCLSSSRVLFPKWQPN